MLEVELKASLRDNPAEQLDRQWEQLGFKPRARLHEVDRYYNGTQRDFRRTDEALRLRSCENETAGTAESLLTYKGPKLDSQSSTRTEYEVAVSDGETADRLLRALGYVPVFTVDKVRRELSCGAVTLCLDEVAGLGRFLELETLVSDGGDREQAVAQLLTLLDQLQVPRANLTRSSYLELLMRK